MISQSEFRSKIIQLRKKKKKIQEIDNGAQFIYTFMSYERRVSQDDEDESDFDDLPNYIEEYDDDEDSENKEEEERFTKITFVMVTEKSVIHFHHFPNTKEFDDEVKTYHFNYPQYLG